MCSLLHLLKQPLVSQAQLGRGCQALAQWQVHLKAVLQCA